jgi:hypothetical protein
VLKTNQSYFILSSFSELQVPPQKNPTFVERKKRSIAGSLKEQFLDEVIPSTQSARVFYIISSIAG